MIRYIGRHVEHIDRRTDDGQSLGLPSLSPRHARAFRPIFNFLNDKDRDILYLIFVSRKKQKDVQHILQRGQPSLCYDIKRIKRRLMFIFYLHSVYDIFLNFIQREMKTAEEGGEPNFSMREIEVMTLMWYTSSFTLTAQVLGTTQVKVRHSYNKCLRRIVEEAEKCEEAKDTHGAHEWRAVYEIFLVIRSNLNIVRRVYKHDKPVK